MRKAYLVTGLLVAAVITTPAPAFAWGAAAHRYIMGRAIDLLPAAMKPFFEHNRDELVLRSNDPDLWRVVGWDDDPNHFIDLGVPEYGAYPFDALPREYGAAIEKFGTATLTKFGLLPWRGQEEFGNLRRSFQGFSTGFQYAAGNTVLFAAVAAHYIQDAQQPLHATNNYDGQMTGQNGVHSRFESVLFERFSSRLQIDPKPLPPATDARALMFESVLAGHRLVDPLLAADREASAGKETYDDDYYEKFFAKVRPMLEQQISLSISRTAAFLAGAWEQAGRPPLKTEVPRPVQKVRGAR